MEWFTGTGTVRSEDSFGKRGICGSSKNSTYFLAQLDPKECSPFFFVGNEIIICKPNLVYLLNRSIFCSIFCNGICKFRRRACWQCCFFAKLCCPKGKHSRKDSALAQTFGKQDPCGSNHTHFHLYILLNNFQCKPWFMEDSSLKPVQEAAILLEYARDG
jgi:hypothetical protein